MYNFFFKRFFDIFFSIIAIPFFLLICFPIAILIIIEDAGPVFYTAERLGKNNVTFKMFKFRSMKVNAPDIRLSDGSTFNSKDDPRVTKIGKFIREYSIDEIPQILNVFRGDMSIIGPRPDVKSNENYYEEFITFLSVKPGITGYNQAYFRNESKRLEKIKNDKYYADNISFIFDLKIFFKTIFMVINKEGIYNK